MRHSQDSVRQLASSGIQHFAGERAGFVPTEASFVSTFFSQLLHWALTQCELQGLNYQNIQKLRDPWGEGAADVLLRVCSGSAQFGRSSVSGGGSGWLPRLHALRQHFFLPLILMLLSQFCKSCGLLHTCRFSLFSLFKLLAWCCRFHGWLMLCLVAYLELVE